MRAAIALLVGALLLAGCGGGSGEPEQAAAPPAAELTDIGSVEDFERELARDEGSPRLLLLLAPT